MCHQSYYKTNKLLVWSHMDAYVFVEKIINIRVATTLAEKNKGKCRNFKTVLRL